MADIDNQEVIKAIKENIGNSSDVRIFMEETIETKICEMFAFYPRGFANFTRNLLNCVLLNFDEKNSEFYQNTV